MGAAPTGSIMENNIAEALNMAQKFANMMRLMYRDRDGFIVIDPRFAKEIDTAVEAARNWTKKTGAVVSFLEKGYGGPEPFASYRHNEV